MSSMLFTVYLSLLVCVYMTNPIWPNIASLKTIIITKQLPFNYAHRPLYMHAMVGRDKIIVIADSACELVS